jgi:hypothetical protein
MVLTDDNCWTWKPFWNEHNKLVDDYNALVRDWNKYIWTARPRRNVGRPLAASEAQRQQVLRLRQSGLDREAFFESLLSGDLRVGQVRPLSLREIAEVTNLGLNTVRTIIAQASRTDRTTVKHLERIDPDRARITRWKRQKRTGNTLPKRIQNRLKEADDLIREAKGLGRA